MKLFDATPAGAAVPRPTVGTYSNTNLYQLGSQQSRSYTKHQNAQPMNPMKKTTALIFSSLIAISSAFAGADVKVGDVTIVHPWARATPGAVKNSAAFMVFDNKGAADKLLSATGDVAREIQIHSMITEAGVMKMREIKSLDIPASGKAELKPGGYHIMLIGLKDGLKEGQKFPLKLKFEKAGEVIVEVTAEKAGGDHSGHKH